MCLLVLGVIHFPDLFCRVELDPFHTLPEHLVSLEIVATPIEARTVRQWG